MKKEKTAANTKTEDTMNSLNNIFSEKVMEHFAKQGKHKAKKKK